MAGKPAIYLSTIRDAQKDTFAVTATTHRRADRARSGVPRRSADQGATNLGKRLAAARA
jgi:hypothetical protein